MSKIVPTASKPANGVEKPRTASRITLKAVIMHPMVMALNFIEFVFSSPSCQYLFSLEGGSGYTEEKPNDYQKDYGDVLWNDLSFLNNGAGSQI